MDPWSIDYFDPPTPKVAPPSLRTRVPKPIPEQEDLFKVQKNTLKILSALDELERALGKGKGGVGEPASGAPFPAKELQQLRREAENAYKVIRSYLENHAV